MITLEQVQQLEERVRDVVGVIQKLRQENNELKNRIEAMESRERMKAEELDRLREDQTLIEEGLKDALNQLGSVTQSTEPAQDDAQNPDSENEIPPSEEQPDEENFDEEAVDNYHTEESSEEEIRREGSWQANDDDSDQPQEDQDQNFHQPPPQNLDIF